MASLAGCATKFPGYKKSLQINNKTEVSQTVDVTIKHVGSDEILHDATHTVNGDSEKIVFDFEEMKEQYIWIEDFKISAETDKYSDSTVYTTDQCHLSPKIVILEDMIDIRYPIC